jgi:hypothetical protein
MNTTNRQIELYVFSSYLDGLDPLNSLINSEIWIIQTFGKTPWTDDPAIHNIGTYTERKHIRNADIHATSEIWTYDPKVWAGESILCLRTSGHCDWQDYTFFRN